MPFPHKERPELKMSALNAWIKLIVGVLVLVLAGEICCRAFFPEYKGHIVKKGTALGKKYRRVNCYGFDMRARHPGSCPVDLTPNDTVVIVTGDSVAEGYGMAYDDTLWACWQRYMDLENIPLKIFPVSKAGHNYQDNFNEISRAIKVLSENQVNIAAVVYQFNLNDLVPFTRKDIRQLKHLESKNSFITNVTMKLVRLRHVYLNHSVMFRVMTNAMARLLFDNSGTPCECLGLEGLAGYTYTFGASGSEAVSATIWEDFREQMKKTLEATGETPFILLFTPIAQFIDPEMRTHPLSRPLRFDCATLNPAEKLEIMAENMNFHFINPGPYMKTAFQNYRQDGNPCRFFLFNDSNHFNETGARYFAEYTFFRIFNQIGINAESRKKAD